VSYRQLIRSNLQTAYGKQPFGQSGISCPFGQSGISCPFGQSGISCPFASKQVARACLMQPIWTINREIRMFDPVGERLSKNMQAGKPLVEYICQQDTSKLQFVVSRHLDTPMNVIDMVK
jgi:hypothetical protein